jgi:hypothetical protein
VIVANWSMVDFSEPADGPEDFPRMEILSEESLREELTRLKGREAAIVNLEPPDDEALQIGIGGPLAGIRHFVHGRDQRVILAGHACANTRLDFRLEADTTAFWPDELIPVDQAIEIIVHFYRTRSFPESVHWKEWDAQTMSWKKAGTDDSPANGTPLSTSSAARDRT